ncbi:MAG: hypothetical protein V3W20_13520 [Candidatus Neomarinimicrobiota bacterium]
MIELYEKAKYLKDQCLLCKHQLYAYYHEASSGDLSTGAWYVECSHCDYEPKEQGFAGFESIEINN